MIFSAYYLDRKICEVEALAAELAARKFFCDRPECQTISLVGDSGDESTFHRTAPGALPIRVYGYDRRREIIRKREEDQAIRSMAGKC